MATTNDRARHARTRKLGIMCKAELVAFWHSLLSRIRVNTKQNIYTGFGEFFPS